MGVRTLILTIVLLFSTPVLAGPPSFYSELTKNKIGTIDNYCFYLITYAQPSLTMRYLMNKNYLDWSLLQQNFDIREMDLGIKVEAELKFLEN